MISLQWLGQHDISSEFAHAHQDRFGFQLPAHLIELVTARVWAYQDIQPPAWSKVQTGAAAQPITHAQVENYSCSVPVFKRKHLVRQQQLMGPSIVLDEAGTFFIGAGWCATVDLYGHLHLQTTTDHR